jgi:hypothetical protein
LLSPQGLGAGIRHYVGRVVASLGVPGVRSDGRGASRRVKQDEERLAALSGPCCNSGHREGDLTGSRYHRLGVIQRFNILCDRSQIRI